MFNHNTLNQLITSLSLGAILSLNIVGFNTAASAQSQYEKDNGYQSNEKSNLFGDTPAGLDPVELIHRAQQLNRRSSTEFNEDYQGQLDNSVSDFKRLQQQRILEQIQPAADPAESSGGNDPQN